MDGLFSLNGRERRAALDEMGRGLEYYIPPQWRGLLSFLAEANPVRGMERAGVAAGEVVAPGATGLERVGAGGRLLSEMAGVAAPAAVAGRVGMPAAEAIQEGLLGVSAGARDVGRAVAERLNQPGPMPTLYSNPVPGLLAERRPGIIAYHGSPHTFEPVILIQMPDGTRVYQNLLERRNLPEGAQILEEYPLGRFDMSKIGTGEGAQAYGRGLYFAESEGVARSYRDALSSTLNNWSVDGVPAGRLQSLDPLKMELAQAVRSGRDVSDAIDYLVSQYRGKMTSRREMIETPENIPVYKEAIDRLNAMRANPPVIERNPGRLYEVRIDAKPEDFLDWDRPLSEQPDIARLMGYDDPDKIAAEKAAQYAKFSAREGDTFEDLFGPLTPEEQAAAERLSSMPMSWGNVTGKDAYESMRNRLGALDWPVGSDATARRTYYEDAATRAAQNLRDQGILGIKYLDAGSRGAGEGSRNYVVFDDRLISIVRMYGIAGAAALLGMSVADVEAALAAQPAQQPAPRGLFGEQ